MDPPQPSASTSTSTSTSVPKRRANACTRCRQQKVRCDGDRPSCSNCRKVKAECIRASNSVEYIRDLEERIRELESREHHSQTGSVPKNHTTQQARSYQPTATSTRVPSGAGAAAVQLDTPVSIDSHIGPSEPLAHDVGLLSLGHTGEPKYLGPSSGVTFARLVYAAIPQSQGLPGIAASTISRATTEQPMARELTKLPEEAEGTYFVNAYFDVWHPFYPFMDEDSFRAVLARIYEHDVNALTFSQCLTEEGDAALVMDAAQCLLVLALGARILESRLGTDFNSCRLYYTGIQRLSQLHMSKLQLHESLRGVQTMLLLVLCGFSFPQGLNAWYLLSTIIASCLDLGLQRKQLHNLASGGQGAHQGLRLENTRSAVFWSAYSLERSLSVILGRPLTLRDEAIDIKFPGGQDTNELEHDAINAASTWASPQAADERSSKRRRMTSTPELGTYNYDPAVYSFRFDRIVAEIKLTLYRVNNFPKRFPWPTDLNSWQNEVHNACETVLSHAEENLKRQGYRRQDQLIHSLKVKYHQCLMILYRPSPGIAEPSVAALQHCYDSATEILRIHQEMSRFANLVSSWLTAHAVFTSGITMLYCIWTSSDIRSRTSMKDLTAHGNACSMVLDRLGKTWTVAGSAKAKFESLVQLTTDSLKRGHLDAGNLQAKETPHSNVNAINESLPRTMSTSTMTIDGSLASLWNDPIGRNMLPDTDLIMDELGDMSSWFDLEWLGDVNFSEDPAVE